MAGEGNGGPVQSVGSDEPYRPQPSQDLLEFIPSLSQYMTWIKWAERLMQTLSQDKPTAEQAPASAEAEMRNLTARIKLQDEKMAELRREKSAQVQALLDSHVEKQGWFDEQMAALVNRAQEVKAMEMAAARPKTGLKADQSLLESVENVGKATYKARRDMSNLVAGKKRPEQAFTKWETTYCKPILDIVQLAKQMKQDQESHQKQHAEQLATLVRREEKTKYLENFNSRTTVSRDKAIAKKEQAFKEEQEKWRLQRAINLAGEELNIVEEKWKTLHEQTFKAHIWDEAKRDNIAAAEKALELKHKKNCADWYRSGRVLGHDEGLKQGRVDTLREFKAQLDAARASGHEAGIQDEKNNRVEDLANAYQEGLAAYDAAGGGGWDHNEEALDQLEGAYRDIQEELDNVREEAQEELQNARTEALYRGLHSGVMMQYWKPEQKFDSDGWPNQAHVYWRGRALAHHHKTRGL